MQMSSFTARRLTAPHAAATTSGAAPARRSTASSASGAPSLASVRPFWNALGARARARAQAASMAER